MNTYTTPKIEKTPGPWKYHLGRGKHPRYHIQTVGGYQIASTPEIDKFPGIKCFQANACLIASAPELLAACRRMLPWIGKLIAEGAHLNSVAPNDAIGAMQEGQAAIEKATVPE